MGKQSQTMERGYTRGTREVHTGREGKGYTKDKWSHARGLHRGFTGAHKEYTR
jgi:hypothetical protein